MTKCCPKCDGKEMIGVRELCCMNCGWKGRKLVQQESCECQKEPRSDPLADAMLVVFFLFMIFLIFYVIVKIITITRG